jgi:transposase-like protein
MGFNKRELKGLLFAINGHVQSDGNSCFKVRSESSNSLYEVSWKNRKWICSCEDYNKRGVKCKHIYAVMYFLTIRDIVVGMKSQREDVACPHCGLGDLVIKRGYAYERSGRVQRYYCKRCKRKFNDRGGLEGARGEAIAIVLALDLYYRGLSLRQIAQHLEAVYGVEVSHTTIYNWIKRYVELVDKYLEKVKLNTGSRWHSDETKVRVSGRHLMLWAVIDSETRLLIAKHISSKRDDENATILFEKALQQSVIKPVELVTDGLKSYGQAVDKVFNDGEIIHIQGPLTGPVSNNKIERFYRTLKQRFKSIYSFRSVEGAETFAKGFSVFYNFIRPHEGIGGQSPMSAACSDTKAAKRWQDFIKESRRRSKQGVSS